MQQDKLNIKNQNIELNNFSSSTFEILTEFLSYESYDNYKHLSLLIGINILDFIKENEYFLNDHTIVIIGNLVNIFEVQLKKLLENSDDNLIKNIIEPNINLKLSLLDEDEKIDNIEIIDSYVSNYKLTWYNYQDLISKTIKEILNKYVVYICINKLETKKFIYVLFCAVADYIWRYIKESTGKNPLRDKINEIFTKIGEDFSILVNSSCDNYVNYSILFIENLLRGSLFDSIKQKNIDINSIYKFTEVYSNLLKSFLFSLFKRNSINEQYLMIGKIFESPFITNDLIKTILKIDNSILENIRYSKIFSGDIDGMMIRQIELKGDEQYLFTEEDNYIQMRKFTKSNDSNLINRLIKNSDGKIKFLEMYSKYQIKNMKKIVSYISYNQRFPQNISLMQYLTNKIEMNEDKLIYLNNLLKDFKIRRINIPLNYLTDGEKERIKIIRILLEDLPIWIIDDCFKNINDDTKKNIVIKFKEILERKNKTILLTDTSETNHYWCPKIFHKINMINI